MSTTFEKIEDELVDLAGKSADRETQNMYLDARTQVREKRPDIEAAFRTQFVSFFERKIVGDPATDKSTNRYDKNLLSLVEDDALTKNIAVNDMATRLTNKCDEELRALSQRMGFLLSEPELADNANPIAPDTIVRALNAAWDQMTAGIQTRLTILRMVEQHMALEMVSVYHDVNSHLVARQILPTLRPTFRRAQPAASRNASKANSAPGSESPLDPTEANLGCRPNPIGSVSPIEPGHATASPQSFGNYSTTALGMPPAEQAIELFETLKRLMSGTSSPSASEESAQRDPIVPEYSSFTTGGFAPVPPRSPAKGSVSTNGTASTGCGISPDASPMRSREYSIPRRQLQSIRAI